jgi:hypothetical protein
LFCRFPFSFSNKIQQECITEELLTLFLAKGNDHRDMPQDSDKPKPQASKGPNIHKAAREYLRMLRSLNPSYDAKAAMSVIVMERPN